MPSSKTTVASAHISPVFLDKAATTAKAVLTIGEAASKGAQLLAFPESFIPGFPVWAALWAPMKNHDLFEMFVNNSIAIDGPEIAALCKAAKQHQIIVSMGFSETSPYSVGCVWNSNVLISADGEILNHHRKLVPTFYEKLIWAPGDGAGLRVSHTPIGNIGGLICGENTNPLSRFALMAQKEQIHISSWPPIWPTKDPKQGNFNNLNANRIRASAHSFEAKCFGIVCAAHMDDAMFDFFVKRDPSVSGILKNTPAAESYFISPTGTQIGESIQGKEGIIYAELDLQECIEPKQFHDVVGYYNRFDIFDLKIDRRRVAPVTWIDDSMG